MDLKDKTNEEFIAYLRMVGDDYEESGHEATHEDYHEAARRIEAMASEHNELEDKP
jgi:hypothetical protein